MTRILIIESDNAKIGADQVKKGMINSFEGACNADGTFKKGWQPPGQWYVQKKGIGRYTVVHNQNTISYGVSCSFIKEQGTMDVGNLTDVSFDVALKQNNEYVDLPFRFMLSFIVKK